MNKITSTLLFFIFLINFSPAYAATNLWSLTSESQVSFAAEMKVNSEVQQLKNRADVISLNKPVLNNLAVGNSVLLPIDNNFYEVTFTRFQKNKNGASLQLIS